MATKKFTDANGNIIRVIGNPKSGGEGDVYNVEGNPNLVVKVYNDKKRSNKQAYKTLIKKIQAMCDICDDAIMGRAGWPQQIVYSNNQPVGFTMNKIKHCNTLHQLTDTLDRKEKFLDNNWKYSILVAYNLAIAVHTLHSKGVVIGDINESNFLIGNRTVAEQQGIIDFENNGIVYCIDCDSFQILTEQEKFLCTVNKAEYLPPELNGVDLHRVERTQNQDNFGLAVLIFQLIMLGKHPFMGVGTPGNVTEAINGGYFVFGEDAEHKQIYPPMPSELYSSIYYSLNDEIRSLFNQAFKPQNELINEINALFNDGLDTINERPTAEDWVNALKRQMEELVQCSNPAHYYDKSGDCIWCKIQNEFGYNPWENKVKPIKINNSYVPTTKKTNNKPKKTNKSVKQKTQQVTPTQSVQTVNTASLNPTSQNIILVNDTYFYRKYHGTIAGKLYLYANALHFESEKYEAKQLSKTIYFDDIANIEKDGSLMPAIVIIYNDGTQDAFTLFNRAIWIAKLYVTLIQGGYQLAQHSPAFDNMNRQYNESSDPDSEIEYFIDAPKWWTDQEWLKEWHKYDIEAQKGNLTVVPGMFKWFFKYFFKGIFKFLVKPLIVAFIIALTTGVDFDTNDGFALFVSLLMLGIIFEGIPKMWLKQPKRSIIFLILAAIFLVMFGFFGSGYKTNDIKTPAIEQTATEKQIDNINSNNSNEEELVYSQEAIKPNDVQKEQSQSNIDIDKIKNEYLDNTIDSIRNHWNPPSNSLAKDVKVRFKILNNGQLDSYEILNSSGVTEVDKAAVQALKSASPFKPFPQEIDNTFVNVTYIFNVN